MKRTFIISGIIVVLLAAGALAYSRLAPRRTTPRGDPVAALAVALGALERTPDQQLTREQITAILPLLKVLRDIDPNDRETSQALVRQIRTIFTPAQVAALERLREEARARRQGGDTPGSGGPGPGGVGPGSTTSRAEFRKRILTRVIDRLESRL